MTELQKTMSNAPSSKGSMRPVMRKVRSNRRMRRVRKCRKSPWRREVPLTLLEALLKAARHSGGELAGGKASEEGHQRVQAAGDDERFAALHGVETDTRNGSGVHRRRSDGFGV